MPEVQSMSEFPADGQWYQHQDGSIVTKQKVTNGEDSIQRVYFNKEIETVPDVTIVEDTAEGPEPKPEPPKQPQPDPEPEPEPTEENTKPDEED